MYMGNYSSRKLSAFAEALQKYSLHPCFAPSGWLWQNDSENKVNTSRQFTLQILTSHVVVAPCGSPLLNEHRWTSSFSGTDIVTTQNPRTIAQVTYHQKALNSHPITSKKQGKWGPPTRFEDFVFFIRNEFDLCIYGVVVRRQYCASFQLQSTPFQGLVGLLMVDGNQVSYTSRTSTSVSTRQDFQRWSDLLMQMMTKTHATSNRINLSEPRPSGNSHIPYFAPLNRLIYTWLPWWKWVDLLAVSVQLCSKGWLSTEASSFLPSHLPL